MDLKRSEINEREKDYWPRGGGGQHEGEKKRKGYDVSFQSVFSLFSLPMHWFAVVQSSQRLTSRCLVTLFSVGISAGISIVLVLSSRYDTGYNLGIIWVLFGIIWYYLGIVRTRDDTRDLKHPGGQEVD